MNKKKMKKTIEEELKELKEDLAYLKSQEYQDEIDNSMFYDMAMSDYIEDLASFNAKVSALEWALTLF